MIVLAIAISRVADQRIPEELKMHTNLVGAAGVQRGLGEGGPAQALEHAITGSSFASQVIIHRHPPAVRAVARNGGSNLTPVPLNFTAGHGVINLFGFAG